MTANPAAPPGRPPGCLVPALTVAYALYPVVWAAAVYGCAALAGDSLGHWPRPGVDPKSLDGTLFTALFGLGMLLGSAWPLGVGGSVLAAGLYAWLASKGRVARRTAGLLGMALPAAAWLAGLVLLRADPWGAAAWFYG